MDWIKHKWPRQGCAQGSGTAMPHISYDSSALALAGSASKDPGLIGQGTSMHLQTLESPLESHVLQSLQRGCLSLTELVWTEDGLQFWIMADWKIFLLSGLFEQGNPSSSKPLSGPH